MKRAQADQAVARMPVEPRAGRRPAVVIADAGDCASLVVLRGRVPPGPGVRFCHRGLTWEIVAYRGSARAWIAHPVEQ